ncbi:MAG: hypothetical protein ACNS62_00055 [Candidatus Cyclobacteriaceae bacterium M3_2C_046]
MNNFVKESISSHLDLWYASANNHLPPLPSFSNGVRSVNQQDLDCLIDKIKQASESKQNDQSIEDLILRIIPSLLNCQTEHLKAFIAGSNKNVSSAFVRKAKKFNPEISNQDIYQAIRNIWIVNSIQALRGDPINLNQALFAYSMLYPYTDNLLDNPSLDKSAKIEFNRRFARRLEGCYVNAAWPVEHEIYQLVEIIEKHFKRAHHRPVYESLLAIHRAQTRSVQLITNPEKISEEQVLHICFDKGGTSVLADGFLINGNLEPAEAEFMMGYGIFLQLLDDLQDLQEDLEASQMTIFSKYAGIFPLDPLVVQLINFQNSILENNPYRDQKADLLQFINQACMLLIFRAIAQNQKYFSSSFLCKMEPCSTLGFDYLKQVAGHQTYSNKLEMEQIMGNFNHIHFNI